jgi:hypothetical protein
MFRMTARQIPAIFKRHCQNCIAWFEHSLVNRYIFVISGMRLHVRVLGSKQHPCVLNSQSLNNIDMLASPIIVIPGVSFWVLVRQTLPRVRFWVSWTDVLSAVSFFSEAIKCNLIASGQDTWFVGPKNTRMIL